MFKHELAERRDIDWFKKHLNEYENAYFGIPGDTRIRIRNAVTREFEDEEIVNKRLNRGIIDPTVVAWKAGRLDNRVIDLEKEEKILNGYGKPIDIAELCGYLNRISDEKSNLKLSPRKTGTVLGYIDEFVESYKMLSLFYGPIPKNMGAVYVINLLYFLSKGAFPIYDKFAHIALKALARGVPPCYVFVGGAPGRNEIKMIKSMYLDYINLIDSLIGLENYSKDRKWDRALWAYGHETEPIK